MHLIERRLLAGLVVLATLVSIGDVTAAESVPVRIEQNRFVFSDTGQPFQPRGFNLVRLDLKEGGEHATFSPLLYDRQQIGRTLQHMADGGYNVVRVFINCYWRRRGTLLESADATQLSAAYLDNLTDFLLQAKQRGVLVIPCFEGLPEAGPYRQFLQPRIENLRGASRMYLHPGYIEAKQAYLRDVIRALRQRAPTTLQAVFCWDLMNEVCFPMGAPPFSLDQGTVTPANGITYDLATEKERLADEMAVYWVDRMADAVRSEIPGALINVNLFTYGAVGRTGPGDFHQDQAEWRNRYSFRPTALLRSKADIIDIHFYSDREEAFAADLASIEFEQLSTRLREYPDKALLVGEFGAFKSRFSQLPEAAAWVTRLADLFPQRGFQGWLYWTYDTDEQEELWNGMSDGGVMFRALPSAEGEMKQ